MFRNTPNKGSSDWLRNFKKWGAVWSVILENCWIHHNVGDILARLNALKIQVPLNRGIMDLGITPSPKRWKIC